MYELKTTQLFRNLVNLPQGHSCFTKKYTVVVPSYSAKV